jgi:hypothetical protein
MKSWLALLCKTAIFFTGKLFTWWFIIVALVCFGLFLIPCRNGIARTLHQFWVKKIFPWKFYLEYGGTFTKLFMHVSSQNMFTTTRNLQIHVHVLFRWLPIMTLCTRFELLRGDYRSCAMFSWWKKKYIYVYSVCTT